MQQSENVSSQNLTGYWKAGAVLFVGGLAAGSGVLRVLRPDRYGYLALTAIGLAAAGAIVRGAPSADNKYSPLALGVLGSCLVGFAGAQALRGLREIVSAVRLRDVVAGRAGCLRAFVGLGIVAPVGQASISWAASIRRRSQRRVNQQIVLYALSRHVATRGRDSRGDGFWSQLLEGFSLTIDLASHEQGGERYHPEILDYVARTNPAALRPLLEGAVREWKAEKTRHFILSTPEKVIPLQTFAEVLEKAGKLSVLHGMLDSIDKSGAIKALKEWQGQESDVFALLQLEAKEGKFSKEDKANFERLWEIYKTMTAYDGAQSLRRVYDRFSAGQFPQGELFDRWDKAKAYYDQVVQPALKAFHQVEETLARREYYQWQATHDPRWESQSKQTQALLFGMWRGVRPRPHEPSYDKWPDLSGEPLFEGYKKWKSENPPTEGPEVQPKVSFKLWLQDRGNLRRWRLAGAPSWEKFNQLRSGNVPGWECLSESERKARYQQFTNNEEKPVVHGLGARLEAIRSAMQSQNGEGRAADDGDGSAAVEALFSALPNMPSTQSRQDWTKQLTEALGGRDYAEMCEFFKGDMATADALFKEGILVVVKGGNRIDFDVLRQVVAQSALHVVKPPAPQEEVERAEPEDAQGFSATLLSRGAEPAGRLAGLTYRVALQALMVGMTFSVYAELALRRTWVFPIAFGLGLWGGWGGGREAVVAAEAARRLSVANVGTRALWQRTAAALEGGGSVFARFVRASFRGFVDGENLFGLSLQWSAFSSVHNLCRGWGWYTFIGAICDGFILGSCVGGLGGRALLSAASRNSAAQRLVNAWPAEQLPAQHQSARGAYANMRSAFEQQS